MAIASAGFIDHAGETGRDVLQQVGPTIAVLVSAMPPGAISPAGLGEVPITHSPEAVTQEVFALIDTGATESCIDQQLADHLALPLVDRRIIGGAGGKHELNVYLGAITIPGLGYAQSGLFTAVKLAEGGSFQKVLLGRTLLRGVIMIYDGRTGAVSLCV